MVELNSATADIAASLGPLAIASSKSIELMHAERSIFVRGSNFALRPLHNRSGTDIKSP